MNFANDNSVIEALQVIKDIMGDDAEYNLHRRLEKKEDGLWYVDGHPTYIDGFYYIVAMGKNHAQVLTAEEYDRAFIQTI